MIYSWTLWNLCWFLPNMWMRLYIKNNNNNNNTEVKLLLTADQFVVSMLNCSRSQICAWHCHYVCVNKDVQHGLVIVSLCVVCVQEGAIDLLRELKGFNMTLKLLQVGSSTAWIALVCLRVQFCHLFKPCHCLKTMQIIQHKTSAWQLKPIMCIDVRVCFRKRGSACPWMVSGSTAQTRKSLLWQRSW